MTQRLRPTHRTTSRFAPRSEVLEPRRLLAATLAADVLPGTGSSAPKEFAVTADGKVYFTHAATSGAVVSRLSVFNPATSTVTPLFSMNPNDGGPINLSAIGNDVYFDARGTSGGWELYKTSGTVASTAMVKDIAPGAANGVTTTNQTPFVQNNIVLNGELYTYGQPGAEGTQTLWKTNAGVLSNTGIALPGMSYHFAKFKSGFAFTNLPFQATTPPKGGVWYFDGTSAPVQLTSLSNGHAKYAAGDKLFFVNTLPGNTNLFVSDGTAAGTQSMGFNATPIGAVNGYALLGRGGQLWRSDGTAAGTQFVSSVAPLGDANAVDVNGVTYFLGQSGSTYGLYRTDGTTNGTVLVQDITSVHTSNMAMARIGDTFYFTGSDAAHGVEVFTTNSIAAVLDAGTLSVAGGLAGNTVAISQSGNTISVDTNGSISTFDATAVHRIFISSGNGDDIVNINSTLTDTVQFHGGAGANTLNVNNVGTTASTSEDLGLLGATTSVNIAAGATFTFAAAQRVNSLSVNGTVVVTPHVSATGLGIETQVLSVGNAGVLDLNDNDLRATATAKSTIESYIRTAYNFGGWDGPSGVFSSTAKNNPAGNTTLGLLSGQEFNDNNGGAFNGQTVNASDVLVKYTYFGDVDFNGSVDVSDYNLIDFGFTNHLTGWANGDADWSGGPTDVSDYNVIDFAFATQAGGL